MQETAGTLPPPVGPVSPAAPEPAGAGPAATPVALPATAPTVTLPPARHAVFWVGILAALVLALWLLKAILLPFVLGMAIAYFLDPVADRLEALRVPRSVAAGLIIVAFFLVATLLLMLIVPTIVEQLTTLVRALPRYVEAAAETLRPLVASILARVSASPPTDLTQPLAAAQSMAGVAGHLLNEALSRGFAFVNSVALLAVTPLVAFYLLRDWEKVVESVDGWLPRAQADVIRAQLREIDWVLAGFARGTATVCLVLGAFYAVALSLVGLDFGLTIGLTAGLVSFIPYIGTLFGLLASVGVALYQFWPNWPRVVVVLMVFFAGQIVNDYVLVPRLVGERVGLHPLWVMFGLFAGGALFGFVGLLIAVPVCAVIGVVTRFAIARYKESPLYLGTVD
ncbi:AI-2E family transporter [Candidatus Binatia bacterium]|nr:AI-2E family transporter [Candidatus Binatia bacterium]